MIATMSSKGQIVIPQEVRKRCGWGVGDHLLVEDHPDQQSITLRKVEKSGNWLQVLKECPYPLEIPPRRKQYYRPKDGLAH